jgi:hypothetical protein
MFRRIRGWVAVLATVVVMLGGAAPALAFVDEGLEAEQKKTPVLFDAFFLRPVGAVLTAGGAVLFVPAGAVVGLTRPSDIGKPFQALVGNPFRYTFMDPLGSH